jgi:hypothetical protein
MRRKKRPKYKKRFWKRRFFNQVGFFGEGPVFGMLQLFYALSETEI